MLDPAAQADRRTEAEKKFEAHAMKYEEARAKKAAVKSHRDRIKARGWAEVQKPSASGSSRRLLRGRPVHERKRSLSGARWPSPAVISCTRLLVQEFNEKLANLTGVGALWGFLLAGAVCTPALQGVLRVCRCA